MTPEEFHQALKAVDAIFTPYRTRREIPNEREAQVTIIGYDTQLAIQDDQAAEQADGQAGKREPPTEAPTAPPPDDSARSRLRPVRLVGAALYSRRDLERYIAKGEQLDINIVGYLSFKDDVTPDLIERAIARLHYRGVLTASPMALEALKRKES
jgi:hypothetical protein